jgi:uncharacterized repeat protein (TIGR02543 family)
MMLFNATTIGTPTSPEKKGFTFGGWFKDSTCNATWDFAKDSVKTNTTIYSKWVVNSYAVYFMIGDHPFSVKVNYNSTFTAPDEPAIAGFTFTGWFKDTHLTNAWNFATDKVISDTSLYPKFMAKVSFNSKGGSLVKDTLVNINGTVLTPVKPIKDGYNFGGWYSDSTFTNAFYFGSDQIALNTTLYAKWIKTTTLVSIAAIEEFKLFPNPIGDDLTIEGSSIKEATIYSPLGNTIMHVNFDNKSVNHIKLSELKPGTYLICLKLNNGDVKNLKLVKE